MLQQKYGYQLQIDALIMAKPDELMQSHEPQILHFTLIRFRDQDFNSERKK